MAIALRGRAASGDRGTRGGDGRERRSARRLRPATRINARGARRPVRIKRVYERPDARDGMRVLVDRLWPRGVSHDRALADLWLKEAAPSDALRRWYGHAPARWESFRRKYRAELAARAGILRLLDDLRRRGPLTLLYGARDVARNNAVVLREVLEENRPARARPHNEERRHASEGRHVDPGDERVAGDAGARDRRAVAARADQRGSGDRARAARRTGERG